MRNNAIEDFRNRGALAGCFCEYRIFIILADSRTVFQQNKHLQGTLKHPVIKLNLTKKFTTNSLSIC